MIDAISLDGELRKLKSKDQIPLGFSKRVLDAQMKRSAGMFRLTRFLDYAHPTTGVMEGETPKSGAAIRAATQSLTELGFQDSELRVVWLRVVQMLAPSTSLLAPWTLLRLLPRVAVHMWEERSRSQEDLQTPPRSSRKVQ